MNFYPESPKNLPADLLAVPNSYKWRVFYVLVSLILFVALFFAFLAGAIWLFYKTVTMNIEFSGIWSILLYAGAIGLTGMLVVFLIKFMFKKTEDGTKNMIELKEKEHPHLFEFVRKLSQETGASFPNKILVNEQVNAAVFYNDTFWSMFLPVKKNLLIGLGLVNSLNLSEFKAVIAHEFGHFSQRSMKLGSYVYMTNRIIHDMVYSRDSWDDALRSWASTDIRISIFAWILMGVIWLIRSVLGLFYMLINRINASLSRQMEFNADLVAVSVTGSDAIINGLAKLDRSNQAVAMALSQLSDAADHKLYSTDVFYHQTEAEKYLIRTNTAFADRTPVKNQTGIPMIFSPDEQSTPSMYASHPCTYDRECNAKKSLIDCAEDSRSPWILFSNPEKLRRQITEKIYANSDIKIEKEDYSTVEKIDQFIKDELEETSFNERYHGNFDERYIHWVEPEVLLASVQKKYVSDAGIKKELATLFQEDWQKELKKRTDLLLEVANIQQQLQSGKKKFEHRGEMYKAAKAEHLINRVNEEVHDQFQKEFAALDRRMQEVYAAMTWKVSGDLREEYKKRLSFQVLIQNLNQMFQRATDRWASLLFEMQEVGDITEAHAKIYKDVFYDEVYMVSVNTYEMAEKAAIPALKNIEEGQILGEFLGGAFSGATRNVLFNDTYRAKFLDKLGQMQARNLRLYSKNLGALISLQEKIEEEFLSLQ